MSTDVPSAPPDPLRPLGTSFRCRCPQCTGSGVRLIECGSGRAASGPCMPCKGNGHIYVFWGTSPRDKQTHALRVASVPAEGLCLHTVPLDLVGGTDSPICTRCGDLFAELAEVEANGPWKLD